MIGEGLRLLALGMTTVFLFLILLVLIMNGTAWFFRRFARHFPEHQPAAVPSGGPDARDAGGPGAGDERARVAAALAAIHARRARQR